MLRFQSTAPRTKPGLTRYVSWRLWMLVAALGLVVASMQYLGRPETARQLEQRLMGPGEVNDRRPSGSAPTLLQQSQAKPPAEAVTPSQDGPASSPPGTGDLSQVKDKTYFRPEEREAWFSLFAALRQMDDSQLASQNVGELTYAQLLQQPENYRGRIVTIRGSVSRAELQRPAKNRHHIDSYCRLWIRPEGGGEWPMVVYCLDLPEGFPLGDALRAPVSVTGFFFKNWSYAYSGGLGLAPVVLAQNLSWSKPAVRPAAKRVSFRHWTIGLATASAVAVLATWQALRLTRRRSPDTETAATIARRLKDLADEGNDA